MTRTEFQRQLALLNDHLSDIAGVAKAMLVDGVRAFESLDHVLAEDVEQRNGHLLEMDDRIEQEALHLMALQQPMAGDLRRIGATLKLITYLTRIGRYGLDIARVLKGWPEGQKHVLNIVDLPRMAHLAIEMLDEDLSAFRDKRAPDLDRIQRLENEVDTMRRRIWDSCLVAMMSSQRSIEALAHYMMVARYLERCGDNACKMAEKLHYVATGERVHIA